jgi:hypothetical protein
MRKLVDVSSRWIFYLLLLALVGIITGAFWVKRLENYPSMYRLGFILTGLCWFAGIIAGIALLIKKPPSSMSTAQSVGITVGKGVALVFLSSIFALIVIYILVASSFRGGF